MKAYEIHPDENWPHKYQVIASHKWGLPGVECYQCGFTGGRIGSQYPSLSLPKGIDSEPYLDKWPVSPERQLELQTALLSAWKRAVKLHPGTDFGPLSGKASGNCGDFCWVGIGTVLLTKHAIKKLHDAGVLFLNLVPTEIKWRSKNSPEYFEIEIATVLKLAPSYLDALGAVSVCSKCGFSKATKELPDRQSRLANAELENCPVLDATALPEKWDMLRVEGWEAKIVASENFKRAVTDAGLTNISFREIKIL